MKTADFLSLLKDTKPIGKDRWQALCPGHADHNPSLSIKEVDSKILIFCHAGCTPDAILGAIGLKLGDLFLDGETVPEAIYQYRNKDGSLAYEKLKYRLPDGGKTFKQRCLVDGQLVYNLEGISRSPYNHPEVIASIKKGEIIVYLEGEKDAETARILGYTGTTMGGAANWKDEWKGFFRNAKIVQIADNDKAGIALVQKVSKSLCEVCKSVRVVILPEGKDLTEWVALGHGRVDLDKLIVASPELVRKSITTMRLATEFLSELRNRPKIDFLIDQLLPDTKQAFMLVSGRPEIGKTNLALCMAFSLATGKPIFSFKTKACKVGYLFIEGGPQQIASRLEKLSTEFNGIPEKLYIESSTPIPLNAKGKARLQELVKDLKVCFVDSLKYLIPGDYMKPADVLNGLNALQDVQSSTGTIFVLIGHIRKPNLKGIIRPDDYWTELKGPTEYLEMATSALLLTRPRHNRDEKGHFITSQDDRELHFVKARDAIRELKPLKLHFDRERLLYLPQGDMWDQEDM